MDLFRKWRGKLALPPSTERRIKIGGNFVIQRVFGGVDAEAEIRKSEVPGHDHIIFDLAPPYREVLLRHRGARRAKTTLPVVTSPDLLNAEELPDTFSLKWDRLGILETYAAKPDAVIGSWINQFNFRVEDEEAGLPGLRLPQIAALHAIAAHCRSVRVKWGDYNPHRPGRNSHHPLLAVLAEAPCILHAWLRSGNTGASRGISEFLKEALALLPAGWKLRTVRADSGFFAQELMEFLEARGLGYVIVVKGG